MNNEKQIKVKIKPVEIEQNIKYFNISNSSEYFKNMIKKYKSSIGKNILYSDINTLLSDYRNQKMLELPESDILRSEIGEEIKQFKENHNLIKSNYNEINSSELKRKNSHTRNKKENRLSVLISLDKFQKQGKFIIPMNRKNINLTNDLSAKNIIIENKNNKRNIFSKLNKNLSTKNIIIENKKIIPKKYFFSTGNTHRTYSTKSLSTNTNLTPIKIKNKDSKIINLRSIYNNKINSLSNNLKNSSIKLRNTYYKYIKNFSNEFDNWKEKQTFKFPQIRIGLKKYE
jgi:hypothetical protein